jgi:non-ribosomal peptide synthase protein (TIGR01720 family)
MLSVFFRSLSGAAFSAETIHIQSSQREQLLDGGLWGQDRIMGYFSAALPFRVPSLGQLRQARRFDNLVKTVAGQFREIRARGFDFLVLQYVLPALDPRNQPFLDSSRILFHYLSEDPLRREDDFYQIVDLTAGPASDPGNPSNYLLNFTVSLSGSGIELTAYYSPDDYTEQSVRYLLAEFQSAVSQLVFAHDNHGRRVVS